MKNSRPHLRLGASSAIALIALFCFAIIQLARAEEPTLPALRSFNEGGPAFRSLNEGGSRTKGPTPQPAEETMPVIKNLTDSLDFLNIIKERELPFEPIALQTALNRILDLWNVQNEAMFNDLNSIEDILPADHKNQITNYRKQLSAIRLRNEDTRERINQNLSAREAIAMGEELRAARRTIEPALNEIVDFTSIFTNQNTIVKATHRLAAITKDEKKIRITLSSARWATFTQLIKQTQTLIKQANQFNKKAVELLIDQDNIEEGITIESLIIKSENNIKATYTNFLAMSKLIKK